jgi:hypothetical protein
LYQYEAAIDSGTDDDGADQLIRVCREVCPNATDEEIAHFIRLKGASKRIKQPLAYLKTAVPKCLQGKSLRQYRRDVQQAREAQAQHDRAKQEALAAHIGQPEFRRAVSNLGS